MGAFGTIGISAPPPVSRSAYLAAGGYPKNPESCRLHRPPDHRRAMRGRATARAEIACEDAFFAHTAIIGAIDVGQWHADRREEDFWSAFFLSGGCRHHFLRWAAVVWA